MAINLPQEVIVDILYRLPAKDLLRCRAVRKAWRSLIDSPDFIGLHLSRSSESRIIFGGRNDLYWVDPEALDSPQRLSFPIDIGSGIDVFGGCHGLVALLNSDGDIAIWNPTTRKHRTLFMSELKHPPLLAVYEVALVGFGYDPIADDYKVLRLVNYHAAERDIPSEAKVYSLKAKAWKRVNDFPSCFRYDRCNGVLVGNALHWVVTRISDNSDALLAFDLACEGRREVPRPDHKDVIRLTNLGGCLCVLNLADYNVELGRTERVDIWVMKEYGVPESWTKLFSVAATNVNTASFMFAVPIAYLKGGHRVLMNQDGERFLVYDLKRKRTRKVRGPGVIPRIVDTHVCTCSLVGVGGDDGKSSGKRPGESRKEGEKQKQQSSGNKKR